MEMLILSSSSKEEFAEKITYQMRRRNIRLYESIEEIKNMASSELRLAIVIDGPTLAYALADDKLGNAFFRLGILAQSVICCRVSPKQKADVVGIAKAQNKWVTLSIGDGANDVPMILEAHIGVGMRGKEGTAAIRNADYVVSQFRYLHRLVLVHGRWGYKRVSFLVCFYFYKNILLAFTEIYFAMQNGFSGQIFFGDMLTTMYNAVWSSWGCLFAYWFE